jgi:hypothetical protein
VALPGAYIHEKEPDMPERESLEHLSGVSNVAFDLISLLHNKLEAIAALETYKRDAQMAGFHHVYDFLQQCQDNDRRTVDHLRAMVANHLVVGLEEHHGFGDDDTMPVPGRAQDADRPADLPDREPAESELVSEASEESFPASDPPAYTTGRDHTTGPAS